MMAEQGSQAQRRAASIARHVTAAKASSPSVAAADSARPAPSGGAGALSVVDERTGRRYSLKISEDGTVRSADLKQITAGGDGNGIKMFDPGCTNTATCRSTVSFIDGGKGVLRYRGIPIEALAEKSTYLETAYLLQYGHLPSRAQLASWEEAVMRHSALPDGVAEAVAALPHDAHFMATIITALTALSAFHPEQNPALQGGGIYKSKEIRDKQVVRIIGKMPALAALAYHRRSGRALCMPPPGLGYAESFLYMLDGMGRTDYRPHPRLARALEVLFILHAEHEMNCSTAACRHLASSGVDVYTAVAGAVGALYGPLHGGANEAVLKMLVEIGSPERIPEFLEGVKAGQRRLSGFGHRVYKNYDPRAKIIRGLAEEVFSIVGRDPLIEVAVALEQAALKDEYFVKRKLYPNVDFYSGLIYRALGFPPEFFTVLFAIPRAAGYLAHWRESLDDSDTKIVRPHQVYQGNWLSGYLPLDARETATEAPDMAEIPVSNATKRRIAGLAI